MNNKLKTIDTKQSFYDIRMNNIFYIDKTKQIYDLITTKWDIFLKRPRRFWKSMLISTLFELFSWNSELFNWLYIKEKTDYNFEEFPVIYINFADFATNQNDYIDEYILNKINIYFQWNIYKIWSFWYNSVISGWFSIWKLIQNIYDLFWKQVVLLVDEYDKIATENYNNKKLNDYIKIVNFLYKWVKEASLDRQLKFTFISGLTKILSNHLLSTLNHLNDIDTMPYFYDICGYTKQEIIDNFNQFNDDYLPLLAQKNWNSIDEELLKIKDFYNWYNFWNENDLIYNPYSINILMQSGIYWYYWSNTWRSSLIVNYLKDVSKDDYLEIIDKIKKWKLSNIWKSDILELNKSWGEISIGTILYITWYLTYKNRKYVLPNKETRVSVMQDFLEIVYWWNSKRTQIYNTWWRTIINGLLENDEYTLKEWLDWLEYLLQHTPHQWQRWNPETALKVRLLDIIDIWLDDNYQSIYIEDSTDNGDVDISIIDKWYKKAVIIEAKWSWTLESAIPQALNQYVTHYQSQWFEVTILWIRRNRDKSKLSYQVYIPQ